MCQHNTSTHARRVDGHTALRNVVEDLKRDGWGRHTILVPGPLYWVSIPPALYLNAIAAFAFLCPAFMAPVQHFCECLVWCGSGALKSSKGNRVQVAFVCSGCVQFGAEL